MTAATPNKQYDSGQAPRIFIKGLNWVGDAIMSTPALTHLRRSFPEARITLMARPWVAAVYEHNPDIDELWPVDDSASTGLFLRAIRMVRAGKFTFGLALPNSFRAAVLLNWGNVHYRIGYRTHGRSLLLNQGVDLKREYLEEHQVFYYLHLLEGLCGKPASLVRMTLNAGELEREEVKKLLAELGLDRGQPLVGLAPGSINSNAKRWPADRYVAVADRLARDAGAEVLLLGSAKELDVLERVAVQCKERVHNLGGRISLSQLIALVERLSGLICNDSGAMHIGAALRIPTVAIFGPTEWNTTYPFSKQAKIVRKDTNCAPCMLRECPIDHKCMTAVTPEDVYEAFKDMLREAQKDKPAAKA